MPATREFRGKLREFRQDAACKYTLTTGNLRLDPIDIVVNKAVGERGRKGGD